MNRVYITCQILTLLLLPIQTQNAFAESPLIERINLSKNEKYSFFEHRFERYEKVGNGFKPNQYPVLYGFSRELSDFTLDFFLWCHDNGFMQINEFELANKASERELTYARAWRSLFDIFEKHTDTFYAMRPYVLGKNLYSIDDEIFQENIKEFNKNKDKIKKNTKISAQNYLYIKKLINENSNSSYNKLIFQVSLINLTKIGGKTSRKIRELSGLIQPSNNEHACREFKQNIINLADAYDELTTTIQKVIDTIDPS